MKSAIKLFLQKTLGYQRYLFLFALYTIRRLQSGKHEEPFDAFLELVPEDGAILDIGANIGVMTTVLALKNRRTPVYSFEPIPENLVTLKRVVKHYRLENVTIMETALGDKNGRIQMIRPSIGKVKMQGLSHVVSDPKATTKEKGSIFSVTIRRLDDMEEMQRLPRISAIKIDVENFEHQVFKGAEKLLVQHKPYIYCELWANEVRTACIDLLKSIGYSVHVHNGQKFVPYTSQEDTNFIFIPAS